MKKMRVVIVDDEPLARERVRTLLEGKSDVEILAECGDGAKAIEAIESLSPDLVFLDIQMPEIDGFDVLMAIEPQRTPLVIFVTAYDQYAVRAFEIHALDYLLKPFDRERFRDALDRARTKLNEDGPDAARRRLAGLMDEMRSKGRYSGRLLVKSEGRILFLPAEEIDWIEAAGNYVRIHLGTTEHLMRETMNGMESRLDPERFVRIHRSTIVNFDRIREMQPAFNNEYVVILRNGTELRLSRKYKGALEERIGKIL